MSRMDRSAVLLKEARVEVRDRAGVEDKLARLIAEGPDRLQLIVDFDYTISRAHKDGKIILAPYFYLVPFLLPCSNLAPWLHSFFLVPLLLPGSILVHFFLSSPPLLLQASKWTVRGVSWRTSPTCRPATRTG